MKEKNSHKKNYMLPILVVTTVGVVGLCSSKKVKALCQKKKERCVVNHFVKNYISDSEEMRHQLHRLSDKQIDFLYRLIHKLGDIKDGIRITGENLDNTRQKIIDDVHEFIMAHVH